MTRDPWLDRWLPLLAGRTVLELGCGAGRDTEALVAAGLDVVAIDQSAESLGEARRRVPQASFHAQDLRSPWPVARADAVVASLSLHYFPWDETTALERRIHALLPPGGVCLCRLNSTNDHHYGASGHPALAPHYYLVDGAPKRFFTKEAVQALFAAGWKWLSLEERTIHRYERPKVVWEAVLERQ